MRWRKKRRNSYAAEEWEALQLAPLWALSELAGLGRRLDEAQLAGLRSQARDFSKRIKNPLVSEVLGSVAKDLDELTARLGSDRRGPEKGLREAGAVLDARADSSEALEFKKTVLGLTVLLSVMGLVRDRSGEELSSAISNVGGWVGLSEGEVAETLRPFMGRELERDTQLVQAAARLVEEATALCDRGSFREAVPKLEQALSMCEGVGSETDVVGGASMLLGLAYTNLGRQEEAVAQLQRAVASFRRIGERAGEYAALYTLGDVYKKTGQLEQAAESYEQSLAIQRELGVEEA